ncbi:unnamed protein product [marine sediment metagenome]|uniref:Uncharacterized protein n=1 Tax=marine sediment metagenome TaxID=412755 RepID=X0RRL5_9ZZZZ
MLRITKLSFLFVALIVVSLTTAAVSRVFAAFLVPVISACTVLTALIVWKSGEFSRKDLPLFLLVAGFVVFTEGAVMNLLTETFIQDNVLFFNEVLSHIFLFAGIITIIAGVMLFSELKKGKASRKESVKFIDYYVIGFLAAFFGGVFAFASIEGNVVLAGGFILTVIWLLLGLKVRREFFGRNHLFMLFLTISTGAYVAIAMSYLLASRLFPLT